MHNGVNEQNCDEKLWMWLEITLTGDSGAGKTNFSFQLTHLFLEENFKVKYYSLEMGICGKLKEMMEKYDCEDIKVSDKCSLDTIKKDSNQFDDLIISFWLFL